MTPMSLMREWLASVPELRKSLELRPGPWEAHEKTTSAEYLSYTVVGGGGQPFAGYRKPQFSLVLVGRKDDQADSVQSKAQLIVDQTMLKPDNCEVMQVNLIGDVIGPSVTDGRRPIVALTLEMLL